MIHKGTSDVCDAFESEESRGGKKRPDPCESCLKAFLQTEHHEPAASYVGGERESYREIQSEMLHLSFRPPKSYTRPNFESGSCIFSGGNAMLANDIGVQLPTLPYRHVVMRMGEMETQPLKFTVIAPARYTSTTFSSGGAVTCPFPTSQSRSTIRVLSICTLSVGDSFPKQWNCSTARRIQSSHYLCNENYSRTSQTFLPWWKGKAAWNYCYVQRGDVHVLFCSLEKQGPIANLLAAPHMPWSAHIDQAQHENRPVSTNLK